MRRARLVFTACAWLATAGAAQIPVSAEFQVNTSTSGRNWFPVVASLAEDGFVVAWYNWFIPQYSNSLTGRRFSVDGAPLAAEFPISEHSPRIPGGAAADAEGNFVVVWGVGAVGPGGGSPSDIHARRHAIDGTPFGGQFQVNTTPGGEYTGPADVARDASGSFVVVWDHYGILGQRFSSDGSTLGDEFQIDGDTATVYSSAAAALPTGRWIVAWAQIEATSEARQIRGRQYEANGQPSGAEFAVSAPTSSNLRVGGVAADVKGGFVVVWERSGLYGGGCPTGIHARAFSAQGAPRGSEFEVDQCRGGYQRAPEVASSANGEFLVVWESHQSSGPDDEGMSVQGRAFAADLVPMSGQFQVNVYSTSSQETAAVAALPNGEFVVAWTSDGSSGDDDIYQSVQARIFRLPFFGDGVETGDAGRWSSAVP
jgi:hypothetical protein